MKRTMSPETRALMDELTRESMERLRKMLDELPEEQRERVALAVARRFLGPPTPHNE